MDNVKEYVMNDVQDFDENDKDDTDEIWDNLLGHCVSVSITEEMIKKV